MLALPLNPCSLGHGPARLCRSWPLSRSKRVSPLKALRAPEQLTLQGQQYSQIVEQLAARALLHASTKKDQAEHCPHIVGIAGAPGSGKSTLAKELAAEVNRQAGAPIAVVLPMDGFHYYRAELDAMPDPKTARARRGAPWTFDVMKFVACVQQVKETGQASAPSFDHGVGDPKPGGIEVVPSHRVVIVEGNYILLLDQEPWRQLQTNNLLDDRIFVDTPLDECMARIFRRQTGHGNTAEQSQQRINDNDRPNGELVTKTKVNADVIVPNIPRRDVEQPTAGLL